MYLSYSIKYTYVECMCESNIMEIYKYEKQTIQWMILVIVELFASVKLSSYIYLNLLSGSN